MTMRHLLLMLVSLLLLLGAVAAARADTSADLDRDRVPLGESVTLTIETDQISAFPDLSQLAADFSLSGQSSTRKMGFANGGVNASTRHQVNLTPRRSGVLTIPSLRVGGERTLALPLTVTAPAAGPPTPRGNATAFLETEVDDPTPYVQQAVGVSVRLYYAVPLASGQLDLDTPEGASLQRIGEDVQSNREVDGRRYNVVERRFLMIPERSGALTIPGARFVGRGVGGWMDDFFGSSRELSARGAARVLQVRPQPVAAPQPWLPLRDLRMRYVEAPRQLRAGEAATVVVEAIARGATQAQMPELAAPSIRGAQVFAEPAQYDETFVDGSPQVKLTRRYSIVPGAAGTLALPGPSLSWWDVRAGRARVSTLPDLTLDVQRGSGGFAAPAPAAGDALAASDARALEGDAPAAGTASRLWPWLAVGFALLWLLTLGWALRRRPSAAPERSVRVLGGASESRPTHTLADLRRVLEGGSLDEVGDVLRGMSSPPAADLDQLTSRLAPPQQRDALQQLRRARWADGDGAAARSALRAAFRNGPVWTAVQTRPVEALPPLYPQG